MRSGKTFKYKEKKTGETSEKFRFGHGFWVGMGQMVAV